MCPLQKGAGHDPGLVWLLLEGSSARAQSHRRGTSCTVGRAVMIARTVCVRIGPESQVIEWDSIEEASEAAGIIPCGPGCLGVHSVAYLDGDHWRVTGQVPPPRSLAEKLAELYPRSECLVLEAPRYWPRPAALNQPLRRPVASPVQGPQPTPADTPKAECAGLHGGRSTRDTPDVNARKGFCLHGHSLVDESNVYLRPHRKGRQCRACMRAADRRPERMARHAELQRARRQRRRQAS
jgi:hypothetical protein